MLSGHRLFSAAVLWSLLLGFVGATPASAVPQTEIDLATPITRSISGTVRLAGGLDQNLLSHVRVRVVPDGGLGDATDPVSVTSPQSLLVGDHAYDVSVGEDRMMVQRDAGVMPDGPLPDEVRRAIGTYQVTGLTPGLYRVQFVVEGLTPDILDGSWYRDDDGSPAVIDLREHTATEIDATLAPVGHDVSSATPELTQLQQSTSPGATRESGRDEATSGLRRIAGTVGVPDGYSLSDLSIFAEAIDGSDAFESAMIDHQTGNYEIANLPPATYRVSFSGLGEAGRKLLRQYWPGKLWSEEAGFVDVTNNDAEGIDAQLQEGRTIAGIVTVPEGFTLDHVTVSAQRTENWYGVPPVAVDPATGYYEIVGLAPGSYTVWFSAFGANLITQYWRGASNWSSASTVSLATTDATDINAEMQPGRNISGTVVVPAGFNPGDVSVSAFQIGGEGFSGFATVDSETGTYRISGLQPGEYKVTFQVFSMDGNDQINLQQQYWHATTSSADASPVDLTAQDASGIDASMQEGLTISGTVTVPHGVDAGQVRVSASPVGGGAVKSSVPDPEDGTYILVGLSPGSYRVTFSQEYQSTAGLATQYWQGSTSYSGAKIIDLSQADVQDIDAVMSRGGAITGIVTGISSIQADWINIVAETLDGHSVAQTPVTGKGDFQFTNLPEGQYRLKLVSFAPGKNLLSRYLTTQDKDSWRVLEGQTLNLSFAYSQHDASIAGNIATIGNPGERESAAAYLYQKLGSQWVLLDVQWILDRGGYRFHDLLPGEYRVGFGIVQCWATEFKGDCDTDYPEPTYWHHGQRDEARATTLVLRELTNLTGVDGVVSFEGVPPTRLAGADRFETAVAISQSEFANDSVDTVVLATGYGFADALSAAPLAAKLGGPLLLTQPDMLTRSTEVELKRLGTETVIIVGGEPTISSAVVMRLETLGYEVIRLAGKDRFATSLAIAAYGWETTGAKEVFLATGLDFPDALASGAAAASVDIPVVLVNGRSSALQPEQLALLREFGVQQIHIAGSDATISKGIGKQLRAYQFDVERYAGSNRVETSAMIAGRFGSHGRPVYLAQGWNYPDALAGAAVAGRQGAGMLLSQKDCLSAGLGETLRASQPSAITLLGAEASLATRVARLSSCS